LELYW